MKLVFYFKQTAIVLFLLYFPFISFSQENNSKPKAKESLKASANIHVTNNGISLFPNLSLGRPATILNVSIGKKNIFFEPELRWGLDGRPWSYIYWVRYKFRKSEKFGFNVGVHPSYVIRQNDVTVNGVLQNRYVAQRNVAAEIVPTYYFSKKFSLGIHYLQSKGLDSNYGNQKSKFIALQAKFPNISVGKNIYLGFFPQIFHLNLDENQGTYINESLTVNKRDFPVYLSSIFTYKISSTIPGDNLIWNVGLNVKL